MAIRYLLSLALLAAACSHPPQQSGPSAGTYSFWFRPSANVLPNRVAREVALVDGTYLRLTLAERQNRLLLSFTAELPGAGQHTGTADFSHLKANRWYHLALGWDAGSQRMEMYLNGVLQQHLRPRPSQHTLGGSSLEVGGVLGSGADAIRFEAKDPRLHDTFQTEEQIRELIGQPPPIQGEGRPRLSGELDLSAYQTVLLYEADFTQPLSVVHESELFDGDRRVRQPDGTEWVLEGQGKAGTENGRLRVETTGDRNAGHLVLWNTRRFPDNVLIEWEMSPRDSVDGLTIIFFAARPRENPAGSPFDAGLPRRDGLFSNYHTGALDTYHISYWAGPRRSANLRKNHGFYLASCGVDRMMGQGPGPHTLRLLKAGGKIRLETNGQTALSFDDDGATYGDTLTDGYIGLRQMGHSQWITYSSFRVYELR